MNYSRGNIHFSGSDLRNDEMKNGYKAPSPLNDHSRKRKQSGHNLESFKNKGFYGNGETVKIKRTFSNANPKETRSLSNNAKVNIYLRIIYIEEMFNISKYSLEDNYH